MKIRLAFTAILLAALFAFPIQAPCGELEVLLSKKPAPPAEGQKKLIGKYSAKNGDFYLLTENGGKLYLMDKNRYNHITLSPIKPDLFEAVPVKGKKFEIAIKKDSLNIKGTEYKRELYGGEGGKTFRIKCIRPVEELRKEAAKASPPIAGGAKKPELVEVAKLDPTIKLDIRYATDNNFMSAAFYSSQRAFLQKPAAEALARAHRKIKKHGFGILIYDAYRPWHVTKMFWDATPPDLKNFVANPKSGSRHNRGTAADVTLYDLKTGKPVDMTSGFDEFSSRAYPDFTGGTSLQRWHRDILIALMKEEGFTVNSCEWWHFDYKGWEQYPVMNVTFEKIR